MRVKYSYLVQLVCLVPHKARHRGRVRRREAPVDKGNIVGDRMTNPMVTGHHGSLNLLLTCYILQLLI